MAIPASPDIDHSANALRVAVETAVAITAGHRRPDEETVPDWALLECWTTVLSRAVDVAAAVLPAELLALM